MKINSNITAYLTNNAYAQNETRFSNATARLSSGYKLNTSGDDPANFAIAAKMRSMIKGLEKVKTNTTTGLSVIQTAEAAMQETEDMIQRMNELSVKAANGTMSPSDRKMVQDEVDQLLKEIDRIAETTEFNGQKLLDGTFQNKGYTNYENTTVIGYSEETKAGKYFFSLKNDGDGDHYTIEDSTTPPPAGYGKATTLFGSTDSRRVSIQSETFRYEDTGKVYEHITITGANGAEVTLKIEGPKLHTGVSTITLGEEEYPVANKKITFNNMMAPGTYKISDLGLDTNDKGEPIIADSDLTRYLFGSSTTVEEVETDSGDKMVKITGSNGAEIVLPPEAFTLKKDYLDSAEDPDEAEELVNNATITITRDEWLTGDYALDKLELDLTGLGSMRLQVGTEEGEVISASIPTMTTEAMGIPKLDVSTERSATEAIDKLNGALEYVNKARAQMGAYENRLEHTETFLDAYNEDLNSSVSRIQDTDMAEQMIEFTNMQILTQAGMSMLSQANEAPQQALQLLQ